MSIITGTIRARATVEAGSTPTIYNVSAPLADTEYSQILNPATKAFMIKVRGTALLKVAFASGQSAITYLTVDNNCTLVQEALNFSGALYFQTNKPSQVIEILEWV